MSERLTALGMGVLVAGLVFLAAPEVGLADNDGVKENGAKESGTKETGGTKEASKGPLTILTRAPVPEEAGVSSEGRIRAALNSRVRVHLVETPLSDVCDLVGGQLGIPVVLDRRALDEMGIGADTPLTCLMKDVRLATFLDFQLGHLELTWEIQNEVLLVTTQETAFNHLETRVYEVSDLVGVARHAKEDYDALVDLIQTTVDPISWDAVGGPSSIIKCLDEPEIQALVVAQSRGSHEKLARLFADLRACLPQAKRANGESEPGPCPVQLRPGERSVREALTKRIDVHFVETPLSDAIEQMKEKLGVEIAVDVRSLDEMGIPLDSPITFRVSGISAEAALDLLLSPLELTVTVEDDFLVILAKETAMSQMIVRVYDVADLLGREEPCFDSLLDAITCGIEPCSWDQVGGPGSVFPLKNRGLRVLTVAQTRHIHRKIERLLADLRAARHAPDPCCELLEQALKRQENPPAGPACMTSADGFQAPVEQSEQPQEGFGAPGSGMF